MFDDWPVVYYPCACIAETMHSVVLESVEGVLISGIVWRERERERERDSVSVSYSSFV